MTHHIDISGFGSPGFQFAIFQFFTFSHMFEEYVGFPDSAIKRSPEVKRRIGGRQSTVLHKSIHPNSTPFRLIAGRYKRPAIHRRNDTYRIILFRQVSISIGQILLGSATFSEYPLDRLHIVGLFIQVRITRNGQKSQTDSDIKKYF